MDGTHAPTTSSATLADGDQLAAVIPFAAGMSARAVRIFGLAADTVVPVQSLPQRSWMPETNRSRAPLYLIVDPD
jgi:hypothetical protein